MNVHHLLSSPSIGAAPGLRIGMLVGSVSVSGGGVSEALRSLSLALHRRPGVSVDVFSLHQEADKPRDFGDIPVHLARTRGPASFGYAPAIQQLLKQHPVDLLHVHGLWMYHSVAARRWSRQTGRPYIVSPHGMLDPWALTNSAWKKRLARWAFEDANLKDASLLHALCDSERDAIAAAGIETPVVVLPNGVEALPPVQGQAAWRSSLGQDAHVLLFLGRITPKKQVAELIRQWTLARQSGSSWHLVLVGPVDPAYQRELQGVIDSGNAGGHVHMTGPLFGDERARAYASADAFVLPSLSEGLPMAVLEAFAAGLPALLTAQCNLPEAFAARCAIEIEPDAASIRCGLRRLFDLGDAERAAMGARARRLAADRFDWDVTARRFADLYATLTHAKAGHL